MIICSCNGLSDRVIRDRIENACNPPRSVAEAYRCCGKPAICGRCAPSLLGILRDLGSAACRQPKDAALIERQPAVA
jgi:bacterioferritin-associated ferredoxin